MEPRPRRRSSAPIVVTIPREKRRGSILFTSILSHCENVLFLERQVLATNFYKNPSSELNNLINN